MLSVRLHPHQVRVADPKQVHAVTRGSWACDHCHGVAPEVREPMWRCVDERCDYDLCHTCFLDHHDAVPFQRQADEGTGLTTGRSQSRAATMRHGACSGEQTTACCTVVSLERGSTLQPLSRSELMPRTTTPSPSPARLASTLHMLPPPPAMLGVGSHNAVRLPIHAHTLLPCSAKVVHADADGRWQCNECHRFAPNAPEPMFHCPHGPCDYDVCSDCVTRVLLSLSQRPQSMPLPPPYLPMTHRHPLQSPLPRQQYMATPLRPPTSLSLPAFMSPVHTVQSRREEELDEPAFLALPQPPASSETQEPPVQALASEEAPTVVKGEQAEEQQERDEVITALVPPSPAGGNNNRPTEVQAPHPQPPRVSQTPLPAMMMMQPQPPAQKARVSSSQQHEVVRPTPQHFLPYASSDAALRHAPSYYYDGRRHGQGQAMQQGGTEGPLTPADYQHFAHMYPPYTLQPTHPALPPPRQPLPPPRASPLTVTLHQHALVVADPNKVYANIEGGWKCNSCHRLSPQAPEPMFHCPQPQCDFDICSECYDHYHIRGMVATAHPQAGLQQMGHKSRLQSSYEPAEPSQQQQASALCAGRSLFSLFGLFGSSKNKNKAHHNHHHDGNHGHSHSQAQELAHKNPDGKANHSTDPKDALSALPPCRVSTHRHALVARAPPSNWSLLNGVVVEWSFECDACGRADADAPQPFYACPKWYCSYSLCSECTAYYAEDGADAPVQGSPIARKGGESHETRPRGVQRDQLEQGTLDYRHSEACCQHATVDRASIMGESATDDALPPFSYHHYVQHQNHPANFAYHAPQGHGGKAYDDYPHSLGFSHLHPGGIDGTARNGGFSVPPSPYMMGGHPMMHPAYQRATE